MFRVALIAYLSLTTVLGPLLCCCNAQQLVSSLDGPKKCCGKSATSHSDALTAKRFAHDHHNGHAHHHHAHSPAKDSPKSDQAPAQDKHDGQNCPCGKQHASLIATAFTDGVQLKAVELPALTWHVAMAMLPVPSEFDAEYASMIAQNRPADLYGREILRAYQIMRC